MSSLATAAGKRPEAIFFCNFPPPFTGQTIGTKLACDLLEDDLGITRMNTSDGEFNLSRAGAGHVRRTRSLLRRTRELVTLLEERRPEILYLVLSSSAAGHLRDILYVHRARPFVGRIVAHIRSGNFAGNFNRTWHAPFTRRMVRDIDAFIFLSESLRTRARGHVPDEKSFVAPNPIDEPLRLTPGEVDSKLTARRDRQELRVVFVGNMIRSKGYLDLGEALHRIRRSGEISVSADYAGGWMCDADRTEFESFLDRSDLRSSVTLHGAVSDRGKIRELLRHADVLVLPTYYPVEAQPRSIIEAFNAGTPVVATAHASIPDYVTDDENGYLVERQAPDQIANALVRLADPRDWERKARNARETYERMFSPEAARTALRRAVLGGGVPAP